MTHMFSFGGHPTIPAATPAGVAVVAAACSGATSPASWPDFRRRRPRSGGSAAKNGHGLHDGHGRTVRNGVATQAVVKLPASILLVAVRPRLVPGARSGVYPASPPPGAAARNAVARVVLAGANVPVTVSVCTLQTLATRRS